MVRGREEWCEDGKSGARTGRVVRGQEEWPLKIPSTNITTLSLDDSAALLNLFNRYNNNNHNNQDNVYGAVIMAEPLREFTRFI